jgi:hypothetical protein
MESPARVYSGCMKKRYIVTLTQSQRQRLKDADIAAALEVTHPTIAWVRREGLGTALQRRPPNRQYRNPGWPAGAQLIALTCSSPPESHGRWTLRLLTNRMVELERVTLYYMRQPGASSKNQLKPWLREHWLIPAKVEGEYVWRMGDLLEVYTHP